MTLNLSDWQPLIVALLPIILGAVYTLVRDAEAHLPQNVKKTVDDLITKIVSGVEQSKFYEGLDSDEAKSMAMTAAQKQLKAWRINVPVETLSTLIESAVRDLQAALPAPAPALAAPTSAATMPASVQPQNTVTPGQTVTAPTVTPQQPQQDSPTTQIAALDAAGDNAKV